MNARTVSKTKSARIGKPALGLREQNKLDKRERIRAAAAELFKRHGYGAATMRQIARRAHVGLGTVFNYADDKRDLVFLIFNEELAAIIDEALKDPRPGDALATQLVAVFRNHYRHLGAKPELTRILLQELTFYSAGKQAEAFLQTRQRLMDGIERLVQAAQRGRRILSKEDPAIIARHLFFVYSAAIRWWIAGPRPDAEAGLADLNRLLELQINGLSPAERVARP